VNDLEVRALLEAVTISTSYYSLSDWMRFQASPLMADSIVERFGDRGGSQEWAPLAESTIRIKEALGVPDPEEPNDRTRSMLQSLAYDHDIQPLPDGAQMNIPGNVDEPILRKKLIVAQEGWRQGEGEMFPGAITPPRPVLVIESADVVMLMTSLQFHIMETVSMMIGASPLGGGSFGAGSSPGTGLARIGP
jgi:hypothetical protein